VVGGTTLTTSGPAGTYESETTWNWGGGVGTSGGISTYYSIPTYQQGVSMAANQGSTTMRNVPDVALTADNVYVLYNNGSSGTFGGTSCAAPLWAAFTALVNQQAVANGLSKVGFLNPTLYAIGNGASSSTNFNDITTGNNFSTSSPTQFAATSGYDLCTGWGTPGGITLINSLAGSPSGPPVITSTLSVTGTKGTAFRYNIVATNHPTSYSASGLPAGLSVNTTTGLITGTPTVPGSFSVPISATNAGTGNASLTINVQGAPAITNGPPPAALVNIGYSFTYTSSGYPAATFSVTSGSLPNQLTLSTAGVISGTPTATGLSTGTITASNGISPAATHGFSIAVQQAPAITNGPPPATVMVDTPYTFTYAASGYPAPTFSVTSGTLPAGLSLSPAGSITGSPTTPGLSPMTVTASNGVSPSATQSFSIAVQQAPAITSGPPPAMATVTSPYSFTFTTSGFPVPTFSVTSGDLPPGLTLSPDGILSGVPTSAGTYTATVDATNGVGTDATQSITITITNAPDTPTLPIWALAVLAFLLFFVATRQKQLVN
jgi:hypothetical protein